MLPGISKPVQLAVVLHVDHRLKDGIRRIDVVKKQLVSMACRLERDDHFYIFNPIVYPRKCSTGENVANIERFTDFYSYYDAIGWEEIFTRLCESCYFNDGIRLVVVISDLKAHSEQFHYCLKSVDEYGCAVILLSVGKSGADGFKHISIGQVEEEILNKLKELNESV